MSEYSERVIRDALRVEEEAMSAADHQEASMSTLEASRPAAAGAAASPAHAPLLELALSGLLLKALYVAVERGIPDLVAGEPRTSAELAGKVGVKPPALHQVLRSLTMAGVFTEESDGAFGLTPVGETLLVGHPSAAREMILTMAGPALWQALAKLPECVVTGRTGMELAHGLTFFDYFQQHPDEQANFNRMMLTFHGAEPAAVAEAYDFSDIGCLVDVGGGLGTMLVAVLSRHPKVQGVLFDLPSVVEQARATIARAGISDRCAFVGGSFFESVPAGGDAYLLSHIIHDWSEERCHTILSRCREAMGRDGRLLIAEWVLPPGAEPHPGKVLDVAMLALVGGRERTADEYAELLAPEGFRLERVIRTTTPVSIVEARVTA
jgi:hypothetical protein